METKVTCSQCGKEFPASEIITYDNNNVCAQCKPAFVQKLKEGVSISTHRFAGFWIRVGAKLIDSIILWVVNWLCTLVIYAIFQPPKLAEDGSMQLGTGYFVALAFSLGLGIFYSTWMVGKYSATLGKMLCGLKVIKADGEPLSYARAFGRYCSEFLSSLVLCIGYIMVASDAEKRGLHDRICNTRVIYK